MRAEGERICLRHQEWARGLAGISEGHIRFLMVMGRGLKMMPLAKERHT